jgi:hypothetical protein
MTVSVVLNGTGQWDRAVVNQRPQIAPAAFKNGPSKRNRKVGWWPEEGRRVERCDEKT